MMNFRTIKAALISTLGNAEAGRFQTIGFQRQSTAEEEIEALPMVTVYYSSGDFPKSSGVNRGPSQHDIVFNIELLVAHPALVDLSVINDSEATALAKQRAMAKFQEAGGLADDAMDELLDTIYQILMDARNIDLCLSKGIVANRWVDNQEKDNPLEKGSLVVLSGSMRYTCRTQEEVTGDVGVYPDTVVLHNDININEDPVQKTAVEIQNT